jgi:hypothetical protein
VRFVPIMIGRDANPRIVKNGDADFERIRAYLQTISDQAELNSVIMTDGDAYRVEVAP